MQRLNFYKLRAKVIVEDLSEALGVLAVWDGAAATEFGLCYPDPRLPALGLRCMLPPHLAGKAAAELGADLVDAADYEAHRIALGVPRGGLDFIYGDAFPHETDMDQLGGVDFDKGCFVGQEVVSRMEHRGTRAHARRAGALRRLCARGRHAGEAGEKAVGTLGSAAARPRPCACCALDRVADALAAGAPLTAGGIAMRLGQAGLGALRIVPARRRRRE